jgi:hypothetical protein
VKQLKATARETVETERFELTGEDILNMLAQVHGLNVDGKTSVEFHVPGGEGWSYTDIDITTDDPIHVTIIRTNTEEL